MILALGALLACLSLIGLLIVYWPWIESMNQSLPKTSSDLRQMQDLLYERNMVLDNLKDLEQDYSFQKITPNDYQALKKKFLEKAVSVYQDIETLENTSDFIKKVNTEISS